VELSGDQLVAIPNPGDGAGVQYSDPSPVFLISSAAWTALGPALLERTL
jgi:hypothetical protein